MNTETAKDYIETLLDYQFDMLFVKNCWGENHVEFIFIQAARILTEKQDIKGWFISKVEETLYSRETITPDIKKRPNYFVPDGFIWFFAHLTRWPEFEEIAQNIEGTPNDPWVSNPARKSSETIREALSDNWEDKVFYETFSTN